MQRKLLFTLRPAFMAVLALTCATLLIALPAVAAAPRVASPAAWSELEFRVLESDDSHTLVEVLFPAPVFRQATIDGTTFDIIGVPGASPLGRSGEPLMSVASTMIAIPPSAGVELRVLETGYDVIPDILPMPYVAEERVPDHMPEMDEVAYSQAGFSHEHAEVGDPAIMRDFRVVPLRVFPLSYDASTQELRATRRLLIELDYSSAGRTNIKTTERQPSRAFREMYEGSIANYEFLGTRYESDSAGKYLIITHNDYYSTILPLAEWKHRRGMEVEIANTSVIGSSSSAIKSYIQTAYDTWAVPPDWILIVGDSELVSTSSYDNYYAQLEGGDDLVDVFIGRLPADSIAECEMLVAKTMGYERTPYMTTTDWFTSSCLIVSQDFDEDDAVYFGDTWYAWGLMDREGFTHQDTLFDRNGSNQYDVHAAITDGRVILNYRGQGVSNWYPPFSCDPSQTNPGYKLPVVMAATCGSGNFTTDGYPCEAWITAGTTATPKGSVASVGTSVVAVGVAGLRSSVNRGFYNALFNLKMYTVAEAKVNGQLNLWNLYGNSYEYNGWNVLGDPELDIWTAVPQTGSITHPASVPNSSSQFDVNVELDGVATQEVLVCVYAPGEVYDYAYTDVNGDVSFSINPATSDTVWITATYHNMHAYEGYAVVTATGPYLAYASHTADDSSTGNNDGIITPGETIELTVSLENTGPEGASGVTGELESGNSYATLGDSTASYGNIPSGNTVSNAVPYTFSVATDCPNGQELALSVIASDAARANWNVSVPDVVVSAADLALDATVVSDVAPGGDGDGTLEVGETAWLNLTVENTGPITLEDVVGVLSSSDSYVAVSDANGEFGDIVGSGGTGASTANSFRISISPQAPPGHQATLSLALSGDGGTYTHSESVSVNVSIGGTAVTGPCGPDNYGYYAYDTGDAWTGQAPTYDWVEITGVGSEMTVIDDDAATTTIALPFTFRYYGVDYTNISVCSNGFLALGTDDYRFGDNSPIPDSHGPEAMLAPFWEDLDPSQGGAIYQYYDSANSRWICQFDEVAHWSGGGPETFEVILYDPIFHPSAGGNGDVVFQYQTVPFPYSCTIGIENAAETTGIQYLYNGSYDPAAATIAAGQAIRFTTAAPDVAPQWLVVDAMSVDDSGGGDGDGIAEPTELVQLVLTLDNLGSGTATSVTGLLSTSDPDVTIDNDSASFGSIGASSSGNNSGSPFRVTIGAVPADDIVEFDLHISSTDTRYDSYDVITLVLDLSQTGIDDGVIPTTFALRQNSPNPFRDGTSMAFSLPTPERVEIGIYNVAGRRIATVCEGDFPAGNHNVAWNGHDETGSPVAAGIYFYRLEAGFNVSTKKMLVLK